MASCMKYEISFYLQNCGETFGEEGEKERKREI